MSRYFIPTEHDEDPQGIILNRWFLFIESVVERAIELADPQDDAEDRIKAFLQAHRDDLDNTFDALLSMFRHLAIPLEPPVGNSSNSIPTLGATNTSSNYGSTLPSVTQVNGNGIAGRFGNLSAARETAEDEPEIIPHHGNGATSVSWVTASRLREAERAAQRQMSTSGVQTTAATAPLHQNGVQDATHINGNGTHALTAWEDDGPAEDDDSAEDDETLLPQTTYTPASISYRRGIRNLASENGHGSVSATEALFDDSSGGTDSSIASATAPTVTRHVFQLPFVIDGGSAARLQTRGGLTLPRFGSMSFATRTRIE